MRTAPKIGDRIQYGDKIYVVVKAKKYCIGCAFFENGKFCREIGKHYICMGCLRPDKKEVIYVEENVNAI